jgi:ABC-type transport system involved in cytochrome bd biosynthesis fused ATPase/permease subunit
MPKACGDSAALRLQPRSLMVAVGPSGSGKTTILDRFCGLLAEERRDWRLQRSTGTSSSPGRREPASCGRCSPMPPRRQEAVLFEASLRNNLTMDQRQGRGVIESWLEHLGLAHLLHRMGGLDGKLPLLTEHFSGGEVYRLCLLRAQLRDRPMPVLDEPTAYLDTEAAERVCQILKERSLQRLVLVSSHDPALIAMADGVLHLTSAERQEAERQHQVGG